MKGRFFGENIALDSGIFLFQDYIETAFDTIE